MKKGHIAEPTRDSIPSDAYGVGSKQPWKPGTARPFMPQFTFKTPLVKIPSSMNGKGK